MEILRLTFKRWRFKMKNDNDIMNMATEELPKHKIVDRFSHRYIFMLGYKAGWKDKKANVFERIYKGRSPIGESE